MDSNKESPPALPENALVIVPVRDLVLFPRSVLPVYLGREQSIAAVQEAMRSERSVGVLLQRDADIKEPRKEDLYTVGTAAGIMRYVTAPNGAHHLLVGGEQRFRIQEYLPGFPYLVARVDYLEEKQDDSKEIAARALYLKQRAEEALQLMSADTRGMFTNALYEIQEPGALADTVAAFSDLEPQKKQTVLETLDVRTRLNLVIDYLSEKLDVLRIAREIDDRTRDKFDSRARERLLREQLATIRHELGEDGKHEEVMEEFETAVTAAAMPENVEQEVRRELKRLGSMAQESAEYALLRTWIEWMVNLPWSKLDNESIDIQHAREVLDEDHYGLDKVKRRILEFLAVRKLNPEGKSPILCLVGPPGVGKTSLGKSIARALGLKFTRASLGGVHDEAEIRGHRRTYIGALPGNIIRALKKTGTRNPVFMLDEIDKLGHGIHGDPASALLEVLDPEQNNSFADNYLGVSFDLSRVLFIATANMLDTIPVPLRDRMEVIEIPGYTAEEKLEIAKRYLIARQLKDNGLTVDNATIEDRAIETVIRSYTREAGVRGLERQIAALLRHDAVRIASGEIDKFNITVNDVSNTLGAPLFEPELAMRTGVAGVATGLAWTPVGGDILFIEATRAPGKNNFILTGQLGDVMRESATAALSLVKSRSACLALTTPWEDSEIHVHVPSGAIPKDGPSAGVAIFIALVSLLTGRSVRHDVAMTGEISLRGLVLPVGGIKEKCLAALRAGIKVVLLPARNKKDLQDIPDAAKNALQFIWLENVDQALEFLFETEPGLQSQVPTHA